ncbi:hypothetical protein [Caudoviricetes sp.]|nr:hypothetical protein [Caudoviricetes sp.]
MDTAQLELFKKDLLNVWAKSIEQVGLPLDMLLVMIFRNASNHGLIANGTMVSVGGQGSFVPDNATLDKWVTNYFGALVATEKANPPTSQDA